jgi:glutathione peroxidase
MFEKIEVNGPGRHPLYTELISAQPSAKTESDEFETKMAGYGIKRSAPGDIFWNFEKFLVGRDGRVIARFAPDVTIDSPLLRDAIDAELGAPVRS